MRRAVIIFAALPTHAQHARCAARAGHCRDCRGEHGGLQAARSPRNAARPRRRRQHRLGACRFVHPPGSDPPLRRASRACTPTASWFAPCSTPCEPTAPQLVNEARSHCKDYRARNGSTIPVKVGAASEAPQRERAQFLNSRLSGNIHQFTLYGDRRPVGVKYEPFLGQRSPQCAAASWPGTTRTRGPSCSWSSRPASPGSAGAARTCS